MGRIKYLAAILLAVLVFPRAAHATLGMCTLTGTVYNVDGSVAANGTVNFRLPSTQTFSADSVQTSLEHVVLDNTGSLPAGTQVPLGARIFIQVGNDKPVSVVVTNNPANCPLAFGTLVGSGAGGVPIPSTVITSITTVNNIPGITDTAVNPPGAGPATLTLSDGYPITFGQATTAAELSGATYSPYSTFMGSVTQGMSLQFNNTAAGGAHVDGQIVAGGTGSPDTDKRDVVEQFLTPTNATHSNGHYELFVADNSGTALGTLGPILDILPSTQTFDYNYNGSEILDVANTTVGTAAQAFLETQSDAGSMFLGTRSSGYTGVDVPAAYDFVETSGGSVKGLYLVSDASTGDEGIHFAANGNISHGNLQLTEDTSADFFLTMPNVVQFLNNTNGAAQVAVSNTFGGGSSQAEFEVENGNGLIGNFSATGAASTFGAPYTANMTYIQGLSAAGLLVNAAGGAIHLGASGQAGVSTLDATEDGSGNFFLEPTNTTGLVRFSGGGTTQAAVQIISTGNNSQDFLQIYPQNITQGIGMSYAEIHEIGSNGNNAMSIDAQGNAQLQFNPNNAGGSAWSYSALGTVNNHHIFSAQNSGTLPSVSGACGTGPTIRAGSTDVAGQLAWGTTSAVTNCLINFGAAWGAAPECVCSAENQVNGIAIACGTNTSTTQLQLVFQGNFLAGSGQVNWNCIGLVNGASG